jgi:hypothetical protein
VSFDPDTTRIVRSWLDEGVTQLPDRVLDSVLDQLPATPQRRPRRWPAGEVRAANTTMAVVLATAAAVVAISLIGLSLLNAERTGGPPASDATPSPTRPATELPSAYDIPVEPGRYALGQGFPADLTFDVREGWTACVISEVEQAVCASGASIAFLVVENVVVHPCNTRLHDPPAGRSIEAFLSALADLPLFRATEPVDITRGGLTGRQVMVTAPVDPQCMDLRTWSVRGRTNGVHAGEVNVVEAFELDETVVAVIGSYTPRVSSAEAIAEMRAVMESVEIWP